MPFPSKQFRSSSEIASDLFNEPNTGRLAELLREFIEAYKRELGAEKS
jgi:hypothetical protein